MRIGIDIDDTLTNTSESFANVVKKYNINFTKKFKDRWTKEEFESFVPYLDEILGCAEFKEDTIKVIQKLNELGHELYIITARGNNYSKNIETITNNMLENNNLTFKEIYYNQYKKSDIAKKLNIDLMIDDNKSVYFNMQNESIDCILFGDKIKTWKEVFEYINRKG